MLAMGFGVDKNEVVENWTGPPVQRAWRVTLEVGVTVCPVIGNGTELENVPLNSSQPF